MDKQTRMYNNFDKPDQDTTREILDTVYEALKERGYNPIDQIVGYIISGDPTYITAHNNARNIIGRIERHDLIAELFKSYLKKPNN